jgi:hypothetical protein
VVLIFSQLLWYGIVVGLWVSVGYLLLGLGLIATLAAILVCRSLGPRPRRKWLANAAGGLAVAALGLALVEARWYTLAQRVLTDGYLREHHNSLRAGRWAAEHLPHDSRVLIDDIVYLDPATFPHAFLKTGLVYWRDL